ncbi:DUF3768 domain-containing protein [Sphingomonas turrisvirgatae]|uniref:DUF3768 domain-containing protein n=1 Tax=Sphingomonas turrisvirgatae TaxID=1888892 RepID=A0A1E3M323_9SPHN|nr:DUF3768 domain-containing protein [Sphingomonas turrisvirgatae]ODP39765.1 hypothetical protein BFL28_09080 [Sphingomonas turrisvirgatae]
MSGRDENTRACNIQAENRAAQIAALNDAFRAGASSGTFAITQGVIALGRGAVVQIMERVQSFTAFYTDNDPYGERDFGAFEWLGQLIYWKIDYYDRQMWQGSPDPADPAVTTRVLTIMLASEY